MTVAPDVLSPEFASDPYRFYKIMRDDFPLFFHDATRSWMVSRYARRPFRGSFRHAPG